MEYYEKCLHPEDALQVDIYSNAMSYPYYKEWKRTICKKCGIVFEVDKDE